MIQTVLSATLTMGGHGIKTLVVVKDTGNLQMRLRLYAYGILLWCLFAHFQKPVRSPRSLPENVISYWFTFLHEQASVIICWLPPVDSCSGIFIWVIFNQHILFVLKPIRGWWMIQLQGAPLIAHRWTFHKFQKQRWGCFHTMSHPSNFPSPWL